FRHTIIRLALQGKLVPHLSGNDGSLAVDQNQLSIPKNWKWATVSEVADSRLGKMLDKGKNKGSFRPYLRNVNVRWFEFDLTDLYEMKFEDDELQEFSLQPGD